MSWILNDPPPKFGAELAECQRYYWRSYRANQYYTTPCLKPLATSPDAKGVLSFWCLLQPPVTMRATPALRVNGTSPGGQITMRNTFTGKTITGKLLLPDVFAISAQGLYRIAISDVTGTLPNTLEVTYEAQIELDCGL